jgi:hypothetical protein
MENKGGGKGGGKMEEKLVAPHGQRMKDQIHMYVFRECLSRLEHVVCITPRTRKAMTLPRIRRRIEYNAYRVIGKDR